jgi:hypothetical protein
MSKPSESASSLPKGYTPGGKPNSASVRLDDPSELNWESTPKGLLNAINMKFFVLRSAVDRESVSHRETQSANL